jgi:hypothetical protein
MSIDWKAEYLKSVESGCITLDKLRETLAELDATDRQVEILSDALAESRREVAALKPVQEPSNYNEFVETACALIKAADDAAADRDYMLDSDDCIAVLRGTWKAPLANDMPKQPTPTAQPAPVQEPVALIARLTNPEQHYEFTDPKKANAVLMSLCQEAADALAAPVQPETDSCGSGAGCLYKVAMIENLESEVERLKAAQPAPVQEPVVFYRCNGCGHAYEQVHPTSCDCMEAGGFDRVEYYTTPPAQPAVPDALNPRDENPAYAAGWNDCRAEMLKGMKP